MYKNKKMCMFDYKYITKTVRNCQVKQNSFSMTLYIRQLRVPYTLKQSLNFVQPRRSALKTQSKVDCLCVDWWDFFPKRWCHIDVIIAWRVIKQAINSLLFSLADVIFQTLMNVRTQAATVVARTPSAQTAQEATFAHVQKDLNQQTKPMEKFLHV